MICLNYFKKQLDRLGQAAVFGVLGTLYYKKGDFKKSIDNYSQALEIYKELKQISEQITCFIGIGNNHFKLNELDEATDYYLESSSICSDNNDLYNFLECLSNLISIHEIQLKWDVVLELYKKVLDVFKVLKDNKGIIVSYFNLGIVEKKLGNIDNSLLFFKEGTNVAIDSNYSEYILKGLSYVGETLFYQGELKEAKNQFIKALTLAEKINAKNAIIQLKILLNSLGLSDIDIKNEINKYKESRVKNNN